MLNAPDPSSPSIMSNPKTDKILTGDATRGEAIYAAAGCASCHRVKGTDALAGGKAFVSAFGTLYAPISRWIPPTGSAIASAIS